MKKIKFSRNQFNQDKLKKWAKSVKKKNNFQCVACGYRKVLHSHHILPKGKHPRLAYKVWNGVTLCKLCHLGANGVHGSGAPRNETVKILRDCLSSESTEAIKNLDFKTSSKKTYKKYKPLRKMNKRKFYK